MQGIDSVVDACSISMVPLSLPLPPSPTAAAMTTVTELSSILIEYLELTYVVSSSFRQCILGKDILFRQGELCLIDKNCLHQDYLTREPASILFLGISNDMFEQIMNKQSTGERISAFLQSALLKQKNLLQYLRFSPNSQQSAVFMEHSLTLLLEELILHDGASLVICQGLLMRIFGLLSTGYEFSLSRELRREMNWLIYEEITQDSGYQNKGYFYKILGEQYGLTPAKFRKERQPFNTAWHCIKWLLLKSP